jgi:hypothetical protein
MPNQDTMQTRVHGANTPCILHLSTRQQYIPQFESDQHEKNYRQTASEAVLFHVRFEASKAMMSRSHLEHYTVSWVNEYTLTSFKTFQ